MKRSVSTRLAVTAAVAAGVIGLGAVVVTGNGTSSAAVGDPLGADWTLVGNASITNDSETPAKVVRLTPASGSQAGWAVYGPTIPTTAGVDISFSFAEWAPTVPGSNWGADGLAFWIQDARETNHSTAPDFGPVGYALGYAPTTGNGLASALLGVGFAAGFDDATADGTGCSTSFPRTGNVSTGVDRPNTITLRGGPGYNGSRTGAYCLLADSVIAASTARFNENYTSRATATRYARVTVDPSGTANPKVRVFYGTAAPALTDTPVIVADAPANLLGATDLRIGFSGSTGARVNNNEVWGVASAYAAYSITVDPQDGTTSPSTTTYQKTPTSAPLTLTPPTKAGFTFLGWYDAASGGNQVAGATATSYDPTGNITLYGQWIADALTTTTTGASTTSTSTTSTTSTTVAPTTTTAATTTTVGATTTTVAPTTSTSIQVAYVIVPTTTSTSTTSTTSTTVPPTTSTAATTTTSTPPMSVAPASVEGAATTSPPAFTGSDALDLAQLALALVALAGLVLGVLRVTRRDEA